MRRQESIGMDQTHEKVQGDHRSQSIRSHNPALFMVLCFYNSLLAFSDLCICLISLIGIEKETDRRNKKSRSRPEPVKQLHTELDLCDLDVTLRKDCTSHHILKNQKYPNLCVWMTLLKMDSEAGQSRNGEEQFKVRQKQAKYSRLLSVAPLTFMSVSVGTNQI